MTSIDQDVTVRRGDDKVLRITLDENGSISGWNFDFAIRERQNEADSVTPAVETADVTIAINDAGDNDSPGIIDVTISDTVTLALSARKYFWSLKRSDAGFESTLSEGVWNSVNTAAR